MKWQRLAGTVSGLTLAAALPFGCSGSKFTSNGAAGTGSGGTNGGTSSSGGKSGNQGGATAAGGSVSSGGVISTGGTGRAGTGGVPPGGGPGTGGVGMAGDISVGGGGTTDGGTITPCNQAFYVNFVLKSAENVPDGSFCAAGCDSWLSIRPAENPVFMPLSNNCGFDCATCSVGVCTDIFCAITPITNQGVFGFWSGPLFVSSQCINGAGVDMSCLEQQCPPPGNFVAKMCGTVNSAQTPDVCDPIGGDTVCVEVEFEYYGGDITVTGTIGL